MRSGFWKSVHILSTTRICTKTQGLATDVHSCTYARAKGKPSPSHSHDTNTNRNQYHMQTCSECGTTSWGSVHFLFMDATSQVRVGAQPLYILLYLKVLFKPKKEKGSNLQMGCSRHSAAGERERERKHVRANHGDLVNTDTSPEPVDMLLLWHFWGPCKHRHVT
jgi:hypothetical protein